MRLREAAACGVPAKELAERFELSLSAVYAIIVGDRRRAPGGPTAPKRQRHVPSTDQRLVQAHLSSRLVVLDVGPSGCWWWPSSSRSRPPRLQIAGQRVAVRSAVYALYFGAADGRVNVRMLCEQSAASIDGSTCVAPWHMTVRGLDAKPALPNESRWARCCPQGHVWDAAATRVSIRSSDAPARVCRVCARQDRRARSAPVRASACGLNGR